MNSRRQRIPSLAALAACFTAMLSVDSHGADPQPLVDNAADARRPNVVLILTDNHGAWTLGCYGNDEIRTPHIDELAREGILFTRCFSSNAVCSPTRATYLTGLMPSQHGVHCYLRAGGAQVGPGAYNTIEEFRSVPEILSEAGYACGLVGKWHLGGNLTPQEGFRYWITKPHGHTSTFHGAEIIENGRVRKEPRYLTEFWTDHAVRFLEENRDGPFFLLLAYNGPYGLGESLTRPARNRHRERYAAERLACFPRNPPHPWLVHNRQYINDLQAIRRYAAEIGGVDDGVGRVIACLDRLEIEEDTLVVFTADQGLCGGHNGMWGMGDHSRPLHAFDGTVHVPLIYRHKGRIPEGQRADLLVSNYDFLPTLLAYLGLEDRKPESPPLPGRDYSGALAGQAPSWQNVVFYEFENCRMIRTDRWKYTKRFPDGPDELYHLERDPGEAVNLAGHLESREMRSELEGRLESFFDRYADSKYDLWRGGASKSHLLTSPAKPVRPEDGAEGVPARPKAAEVPEISPPGPSGGRRRP